MFRVTETRLTKVSGAPSTLTMPETAATPSMSLLGLLRRENVGFLRTRQTERDVFKMSDEGQQSACSNSVFLLDMCQGGGGLDDRHRVSWDGS